MKRYLIGVAALAVAAHAQTPGVEPCGGVGSCVRVGTTDGGQVQLGGALQTSRYAQSDGGAARARIESLSPIPGMEMLGNQPRTARQPDVIIGGKVARDGGQGPIVSVRTGPYEIAKFDTAGLVVNGTVTSTGSSRVTGSGTRIYDFPALTAVIGEMNTVCATSFSGTATGCAFGDSVTLGIDQTRPAFGTLQASLTAANTFVIEACAVGITDGGSFDMPDASYTVRCFR